MKISSAILFASLFLAVPALAQEAPVPHKSPRTPVNRESLAERAAAPTSREVQGQITILDTEKLHIGDFDIRLFGIVPPQLSASFGPQARAALDELTARQNVTCLIRDRDREGRFLATCHNAANNDLAVEILRRGLAVVARGSVSSTDLAPAYLAAEQAAQIQKLGLWSNLPPAPAPMPVAEAPKPPVVAAVTPTPTVVEKPVTVSVKTDTKPAHNVEVAVPETRDEVVPSASPSFMARYQLLITGMLMLATALGMLGAIAIQRRIDRRTEMRAIAAALRGELMAARAVCMGRLKLAGDKDISWPRIRSTLYQAYVGRLGWLGAELARWVASIYGQASDYASYYGDSDDARNSTMPKRQALQTLIRHIDEVLPRLALIEHSGNAAAADMGLRQAAVSMHTEASPVVSPANNVSLNTITSPVSKLWVRVQDLAHRQWAPSHQPHQSQDAIAEYTAMIEEEMKRFAFDDGEEDVSMHNLTKLHETGT